MKYFVAFAVACFCIFSSAARAENSFQFETSKYWCDVLKGRYDGKRCTATYQRSTHQACQVYSSMNVDDPELADAARRIKSADRCLAEVTDQAKLNTLKLRIALRGLVTAGRNEDVNDPLAAGFSMPRKGEPRFLKAAAFFLYECVVQECERN